MRPISTLTSKGQVTVPVEVRRHLGLSPSDKVEWVIGKGGRVEMRPTRQLTILDLEGILPALPGRETEDFDDWIAEAMDDAVDQMLES